ncbi:Site-specific recombinase XerD [Pedobacter sp. ok626]|uniref:site-specific integrase n=1 Tax=Pedobacter sp. ok626 TaxID=1761882 RepID=UPI0008875AB1|nr:site-specific integrase [Pedobacter sp. ok626]SDK58615.1 Site-specific recombinase XerD [Pedobacter sp. ok626]
MATVNFYLDKPNRKDQRPILLTYLLNGAKIRFSTKLKTTDKDWNPKEQKVKRNGANESEINFALDEFKRVITKAELDTKFDPSSLTLDLIRSKLEDATGKKKAAFTIFDAFEEYIREAEITKTISSKKIYEVTLNKIKAFNEDKRYQLSFDNVDSKFESKFTDYLINDHKLVNNTIGRYIKTIKSFMHFAAERGYTNNYKFKSFRVIKQDADIIYLTEEELLKIYHFKNLPPRLDAVRDAFCLGCFTGLRFSDLAELRFANLKQDFIELKSKKTRDFLRIPLNDYAKAILNKHKGNPPQVISNQKMNDYIKEIGELAEINGNIILTQYQGAIRIEKAEPKYNFLSTHTARRTFVTLSLEKGMRPEVVMSITGHKDYPTFKKYIKLTENVKLAEMNNAWN